MWDGKEEEHTLKATEIFWKQLCVEILFIDSLKLSTKSSGHLKCYRGNQVAKPGVSVKWLRICPLFRMAR